MKISKPSQSYFPLEFQISRDEWDYYEFRRGIFPERGELSIPDFQVLRKIIMRIYEKKGLAVFSPFPLRAGQLNATGLIEEVMRCVIRRYCETVDAGAFAEGLARAGDELGAQALERATGEFIRTFPPFRVLMGKSSLPGFLGEKTGGIPNRHIAAAELLILHLANGNPAFSPARELFNDAELSAKSDYAALAAALENFFKSRPGLGKNNKPLFDFLREPILAGGSSLTAQLIFIKDHWREYLTEELLLRILTALDIIKEEEKAGFMGRGPALVPMFRGEEYALGKEYERFTEDRDWMSKVVLIAKSVYVWMDQLSAKYGRSIERLDQIPDAELDTLAGWGFSGLWLIGVWERSPASRKIKQICGNPEALSSAYSLYDYAISKELGGDEAFQNLKDRAWKRGIRLASDVVPNHTGIYSRWVIEHPERFIQLDHPPYPSYRFTGPELSDDERVSIRVEDGYWTRRDAAVVFQRRDKLTGAVKYIYHGNDGTSMPWNDTAQLNFLMSDVREAVIQTILNVARKFPIIRFDAAMTLARKHYQRLWFPFPGAGGGIPSRAERGLSREEFDRLMPREFWREVVDRVTSELPDTLLLAEAFWLMEGYFVRTLGMHRVYNSAFMNMLKMEENEKYRAVVKNVLEFDPRILKRFVNFMNNPDERTATEQFGTGDKYFGVCLMMVTMPGLPMFGHGQIEGLKEKYGMEYRRAYWREQIDWALVRRHEAEIFPLMRKRRLFSGVENFVFYDFYLRDGGVNENVFAYSNRSGSERALIVYHNKYEETSGWIRTSCAMAAGPEGGDNKLVRKTLAEGLGLNDAPDRYYIFKDYKTNLEYIRSGAELARHGMFVSLAAFQFHAFMDFRETADGPSGYYRRTAESLGGRGVRSVEAALRELMLSPVHDPLRILLDPETVEPLLGAPDENRPAFRRKAAEFVEAVNRFIGSPGDAGAVSGDIGRCLEGFLALKETSKAGGPGGDYIRSGDKKEPAIDALIAAWMAVRSLGKLKTLLEPELQSAALIDELLLGKIMTETFRRYGCDPWAAGRNTALVEILTVHDGWFDPASPEKGIAAFRTMLNDADVRLFLNFNRHDGIIWFNKERMEQLLHGLFTIAAIRLLSETKPGGKAGEGMKELYEAISRLIDMAERSGYEAEKLLAML